MRLASIIWMVLALQLALVPAPASAQEELPRAQQTRYRELIAKALQEYQLGHWPEARVFFADAHQIWPNARTLRGLGMTCYEARSYVEAIQFLEQALQSQVQPLTDKLASEARNILEQAKRFVTHAYITVTPDGANVTLDDKPFERRYDGAVLLDPGEHQLDASSPGYRPQHRSFTAEAGRPMHLRVELVSDAPLPNGVAEAVDDAPAQLAGAPEAALKAGQAAVQEGEEGELTLGEQSPGAAAALVGLGLAGMTTGWLFYDLHNKVRRDLWFNGAQSPFMMDADIDQSQLQTLRTRGAIAIGAGAAGGLMFTLAQLFWLPDDPGVPPWAWVVGGAGAAVALTAVGLAAFAKHCDVTNYELSCQRITADVMFAPMLATLSIPMLSLPIVYLARPREPLQPEEAAEEQVSFSVGSVGSGGLQLQLSGRF